MPVTDTIKIADIKTGRLNFRYLPGYAKYLLENKLQEYTRYTLEKTKEIEIPMMKFLEQMPPEELMQLSMQGSMELLEYFAENRVEEYINLSLKRWLENELPVIHSDEVVAKDISSVSFIRRKAFRDFISGYCADLKTCLNIMEEVDRFTIVLEEACYDTIFELQKQKINDHHRILTQEIKQNEETFRQLINNAPDAVIVINEDSNILLWNPKAEEIFGWKEAEILGKTLTETIIPLSYRDGHLNGIKRLHQTGEVHVINKTIEITALNKSGKEFYIALSISRSMRAGKQVFISFIRDISNEKKSELDLAQHRNELTQKNMELELSNQQLTSFNYIASHDLQEPLRKIRIYSNRIIEKNLSGIPEDTQDYLQRIIKSAAHMQQLIDDLLAFSRATASDQIFEKTDLNVLLEEIQNSLKHSIDEKNVKITIGNLPELKIIPFQFQQLLENIISNAIKYSKPEVVPEINITSDTVDGKHYINSGAQQQAKYYRISVADNGIGFDEQYAGKIFELFQRLHGKSEYSGTGIGLAICKKIAENHKGFITAQSREGEGSMFSIFVPVTEQAGTGKANKIK